MASYIIHTCPTREWYVTDYLIPDMKAQGITDIEVWNDTEKRGNLRACMECFTEIGKRGEQRWHLQDDIVISRDFREKTERYDDGIVCGYVREEWQPMGVRAGVVPAVFMWNSFPCIHIPDEYARDMAEWFYTDAAFRDTYRDNVRLNRGDDSMWFDWVMECHLEDEVRNLSPCIVDHIDFLIGGSVTNYERGFQTRATLWDDEEAFERIRDKLASR